MNNTNRARLARHASFLSLTIALAASGAQAQTGPSITLAPITVTGEKVDRDMMDTASSVAVLSGEEIEAKAGKSDVASAIAGTPNVIYTDSVSTPIIRGQNSEGPHTGANAFFGGTVPRATVNLDGHYLDYNELYFGATSAWDVDSVEVFRGPQTTSQGANAIGGAIIVNTKDPTFEREGAYRLEFGNYDHRRASLMWNTPLGSDFAARVTLDYSARDTFIDYVEPSFIQNEIGEDFETLNGRAKLLWQPSELPGLEMLLTYSNTDTTRPSAEGASPPYDDLDTITTMMPGWHQLTDTLVWDTTYDFANGIALTNQMQSSTQTIHRRTGAAGRGDADISRDSWSNETKLTFGQTGDQVSGVAGLYYAHVAQDDWLDQGGISTFDDDKKNLGLYGEVSWRLTDRWTLTGGLRYQRDEVSRSGEVSPLFANSDLDYSETFEELLPKLTLAYEVSPELTIGGLISKGYNPGGVSLDFTGSNDWTEYDAEAVWNYELFARASLMDGRLQLNGNLFYMDYRDAQNSITQVVGGVANIHTINADEAEAYGLEISATYQPNEDLRLNAGLGLLHTEVTKFVAAPDYTGNAFARAPGGMVSLGVDWQATEALTIGGQARYVGGYESDIGNTDSYEIDSYSLVDLNASYALSGGLELYGYVNNLFDERAPVLKQATRGSAAPFTQASMTAPRMIGLGLRGQF